ncbi:MAG: hypothetical protein JO022_06320, partial [Acidobacteriaceae bacterium]|nr:hypothetical protein [Acidobacteriaceae bacterium]
KGSNPAAANRLSRVVDQYPLYSKADLALWQLGDSYSKMGTRFRTKAGDAYARIVKEYPLSPYADDAKRRLTDLELPVPEADRAAYERQKWELEHREKPGMVSRNTQFLKRGPDVSMAAKSGAPAMSSIRPTVPVSVPVPVGAAAGAGGINGDVSAVVGDGTQTPTKPDARLNQPAAGTTAAPDNATPAAAQPAAPGATPAAAKPGDPQTNQQEPLPANSTYQQKAKKKSKKQKKQDADNAAKAAAAAQSATPASTATPTAKQ